MTIYKGILSSYGVSRTKKVGIDHVTEYSMIEIDNTELRSIEASDLTASYIQIALGKQIELLVGFGTSPFSKRVLGIKYDGKLRKERINGPIRGLIVSALFTFFSAWLWFSYGWFGFIPFALFGIASLAAARNIKSLIQFS